MRMEELLIGATLLLGIGMLSSCNISAGDLGLPVLYISEAAAASDCSSDGGDGSCVEEAITKTQECEGEECSPFPEFVEDEVSVRDSGRAPSCNKTDKAVPQKSSGLMCN